MEIDVNLRRELVFWSPMIFYFIAVGIPLRASELRRENKVCFRLYGQEDLS